MINLNSEEFNAPVKESKQPFNGGKAGVVTGCVCEVIKRGSDEGTNKPLWKLEIVEDGKDVYPVNKGYFETNLFGADNDGVLKNFKSEAHQTMFINELSHLYKVAMGTELKTVKSDFKDYNDMLTWVMSTVQPVFKTIKVDVVVDYGNPGYVKTFLQLNGYPRFIKNNTDSETTLSLKTNAVVIRPEPDAPEEIEFKKDDSKLPF